MHRHLLLKDSYFWANQVRNAECDVIHLPGVTADVFSLFLEWLYTGRLPELSDLLSALKGPVPFINVEEDKKLVAMAWNICADGNDSFSQLSPEELRFVGNP